MGLLITQKIIFGACMKDKRTFTKMVTGFGVGLLISLVTFNIAYSETKAPDELVTKKDIKSCFKHIKKTEDFLYPHSLKIEAAHYVVEESKLRLTLSISEKTEYGGSAGIQKKDCLLDK